MCCVAIWRKHCEKFCWLWLVIKHAVLVFPGRASLLTILDNSDVLPGRASFQFKLFYVSF